MRLLIAYILILHYLFSLYSCVDCSIILNLNYQVLYLLTSNQYLYVIIFISRKAKLFIVISLIYLNLLLLYCNFYKQKNKKYVYIISLIHLQILYPQYNFYLWINENNTKYYQPSLRYILHLIFQMKKQIVLTRLVSVILYISYFCQKNRYMQLTRFFLYIRFHILSRETSN